MLNTYGTGIYTLGVLKLKAEIGDNREFNQDPKKGK